MLFSSLTFLFAFLPLVFIIYYIIPNRYLRNVVLLLFSLGFYSWGEPSYIVLMLFSLVFNYSFVLAFDYCKQKHNIVLARVIFVLTIMVNLGLLGYYKYAAFLIGNINFMFKTNLPLVKVALPIGISFYTFQILSYVVDAYYGKVKVQKDFVLLSTYVALFPQLIAGPIVRYQTIEDELLNRKENINDVANGIRRFIIGLGKKVILANQAGLIADTIINQSNYVGFSLAWVGILAYSLQIYFDFSGYSDMAIGLGKVFGFHFLENFNYPYIASSITDFWRRWHMSLSTWFKDYVYIPLGGNQVKAYRWYINIFIVWFLTGMWHGATWNFIIWGLYFCIILIIEKIIMLKVLKHVPDFFRHIYALFFIVLGWVIFRIEDPTKMIQYFKTLFGMNGNNSIKAFYHLEIAHLFPYLLLGMLGATPLVGVILKKMNKHTLTGMLLDVYLLGVFVVCIIFLVNSSYNPFIYFRF